MESLRFEKSKISLNILGIRKNNLNFRKYLLVLFI